MLDLISSTLWSEGLNFSYVLATFVDSLITKVFPQRL